MKARKRLVIATFITSIVSLLIAVLTHFIFNSMFNSIVLPSFIENFSFAVFGSALLGFVMSLIEYYVSRKKALENYYLEAIKVLNLFSIIKYFFFAEPKDLVQEYFSEEIVNEILLNRKRSKYNCSLYKHMESVWRKTLDIPEPEFSLFAHQQFDETVKSYRHSVISTIESYIKVSEKNIAFLDTAYAELDFVFKNKSLRNMIYKEIHKPLFEHKNLIDEKSYHFRTYLQANHGNTPVMLDYIDELQKTLFTVKKSSHDQFDFFIIYYTFLVIWMINLKS